MQDFFEMREKLAKDFSSKQSEWITAPDMGTPENAYVCFRGVFLGKGSKPIDLDLYVSGNERLRVWFNGTLLGDGPSPSPSQYGYVDVYRLPTSLCRDENVVSILCHCTGIGGIGGPSLLAELRDADGGVVLGTSSRWEACHSGAWRAQTYHFRMNWFDPWQEWLDARKLPSDWTTRLTPVFGNAVEVRPAPKRELYLRDIPPLIRRPVRARSIVHQEELTALDNRMRPEDLSIALSMVGHPPKRIRIEQAEALLASDASGPAVLSIAKPLTPGEPILEPALVLDFGRQLKGCLEIEVEGPAGATLDFGFSEQLIDGWFNNSLEGQLCARYILREGRQVWRMFSWRAWRYLKVRLREVGPVKIHRLEAIEETWLEEPAENFRSADGSLQRVYDLCMRTLDLGCGEIVMDTPWREQGQWLGDAAGVTLELILANWKDSSLAAKFLREASWNCADSGLLLNITSVGANVGPNRNPIPDYSLWWVRALWIYYLNTGRREFLKALYPQVRGVLDAFNLYINAEGLIENMPGWVFIDWAALDREGACAALNGVYALALRHGALIADAAGEAVDAEGYRARYECVSSAFRRTFWSDERGCYMDASRNGCLSTVVSEHTNAMALWAELASEVQRGPIIENVFRVPFSDVVEAQPFFTAFVLQALDAVGEFDLALSIVRERWGGRMVDRGYETALEEWSCLGSWRSGKFEGFLRSQSHVWSAAPGYFLIDNLIGLKILEPGGGRISVTPRNIGADYQIRRPLAGGWLTVKCRGGSLSLFLRRASKSLSLCPTVTVPATVEKVKGYRGRNGRSFSPRSSQGLLGGHFFW